MRDVESLCEQAGLGKLSKSTASRICEELKERFDRFRRRDLYDVTLLVSTALRTIRLHDRSETLAVNPGPDRRSSESTR